MDTLYIVIPNASQAFKSFIYSLTNDLNTVWIEDDLNLPDLINKKILFALEIDDCGFNNTLFSIISKLYKRGKNSLSSSSAILIVQSPNELYTKSSSQNIIFLLNQIGCSFIGHPLIEATKDLNNFMTWKKRLGLELDNVYFHLCKKLIKNFMKKHYKIIYNPNILALHASSYETSNTLMLWNMVKENLNNCTINEFHVENGTITDCKGCSYIACKHYSENDSCFYGGTITKELLPSIKKADCIIWICPNYNDAISAKLMAVINRLTVLYRKIKFYDKTIFSIIVSGNSGSDSVAKQLIGALNINKGFHIPPNFSLMATANDPKSILNVDDIDLKSKEFADHIMDNIKK